ncbi:MAG: DUF1810 domain-containing protein [Clostridiales bacterium]|jgi:uncharacterized protein (DUF1810 family)|nr:DUF1810 domain-containing protein [Clostridiales bacterium]
MDTQIKPLSRFAEAQANGVYEQALAEIRAGRKQSHWIWFIFPQIEGLGYSSTAQFYGVQGLQEARDYLADAVLGTRLREICAALLELESSDPLEVLGSPDDLKLCSSMTLFAFAAPDDPLFAAVLKKFYNGERCGLTERKLLRDR